MTVAFMGETSEIGVAELLSVLANRKHSGRLTIISDGEEVQIYLQDGKVVLVSSSNHALRLGRILVRLGLLEHTYIDAALREQDVQRGSRPLGQILIDSGWIEPEQLERAAEEQCIEALTQVIVSNHGSFMFNRDALPQTKKGLVALNTDRIVLEASRRADEMMTLKSLLPEPTARIAIAPRKSPTNPDEINQHEKHVLDSIGAGASTLNELTRRVSIGEVALWRSIVRLRERGVIQVCSDHVHAYPVSPTVRERSVEEIAELCDSPTGTLITRVPSLGDFRTGTPASSQLIAAITVVVREVIAAFNAGLTLRAYAHFSDDHFRRQGKMPEEDLRILRAPAYPLREEEQETFLAVSGVCMLKDGRAGSILHTWIPSVGECKKVLIYEKDDDRWLIDGVIETPAQKAGTAFLSPLPAIEQEPQTGMNRATG